EVRLLENLINLDQFEAAGQMRVRIDVRVERYNFHTHRLTLPRDLAADPAKADHAQCFAGELHAFELVPLPLPVLQSNVGLRNVTGEGEQHGDCVFCSCCGGAAGRVHHENSVLRGGIDINVVDTDPGPSDNFQPARLLHQFAVDCRGAAYDNAVGLS